MRVVDRNLVKAVWLGAGLAAFLAVVAAPAAQAQCVSLGALTPYTQDFNTLASTGTSN